MSVLRVRGVTVRLPGRAAPVLEGIDLDLKQGEIVAIVGESGAGKTMLLRSLCGALPMGAQIVGGVVRADGCKVAPVLQAPMAGLSPLRRTGAQIADAAAPGGEPPAVLLDRLGLPSGTAERFPQDLSGGMQMRVALARALATGAGLILVDEPTAALDGPTARSVLEVLGVVRALGRTVLMVTHDPALVAGVCDRIAVMQSGRLVETGTAQDMLARPAHPYSVALMGALPGRARRMADAPGPVVAGQERAPVLEVRDVALSRDGGAGLSGISLGLQEGEVLAVCGESGSGKTTLARIVARLAPLSAGSIRLHGAEIGAIAPRRFSTDPRRSEIQMVFQDPAASFAPWQTVGQSLPPTDPETLAQASLAAGLDPALLARRPGQLSQGQLARAALVRAVIVAPRVLVLDEPTAALDATVQAGVSQYLNELRRGGMAMLLVTHDLHVARILADRLAVLHAGRIVETGQVAQLLSDPVHPATRALVAAMP
jgi:peptide/nickel transport system ATP-binding protein